MNDLQQFIAYKAYQIRRWSLIMTTEAGSGHPTSCLSAADIVAVLFFYAMRYSARNFENPNNDRFILSKGHAAPVLYAAWKEIGVLTENDLLSYRRFDSTLEGHPTLRFKYAEAATGALGIGLSIGLGQALNARMDKRDYRVYVLLGDSEMTEGCIWEAMQVGAFYKTNNLIGIIDCNRLGQSTQTIEGHDTKKYEMMAQSFGWHTIVVDGHDIAQIMDACDQAKKITDKPGMIIAKTFKGYGIARAQDKQGFHGKAFAKEELDAVLQELAQQFPDAAAYKNTYTWQPQEPQKNERAIRFEPKRIVLPVPSYTAKDHLATRKAYGQALAALGGVCEEVISLDAEVKNSTYAELFEAKYPERFVQCFIAEQNMVGMAAGFERRGKIPFVSTFGAFFTRAHDQIRMAAIGSAALRLVGSHAGVSIGEDGPSQMALEDIALMRTLPNSIVLYPSDAISAWKLVEHMARYNSGISYLRTTRPVTPVLYKVDEEFVIGGCKVLHKDKRDQVCVVAAGITLHEALTAYEQLILYDKPIFISVIDLYSIKPLDRTTLIKTAQAAGNKIITVEDHYSQGGIGEAVAHALSDTTISIESLAVNQLPRSGTPQELLAYAGIDAAAIIKKVHELI